MHALDSGPGPIAQQPEAGRVEPLVAAIRNVLAARDLPSVMAEVRGAARRLANADGAGFVLREGTMVHHADEDAIAPLWRGRRFPEHLCVSGVAMRTRETVVIEDVREDPRVSQEVYRGTFVRSLAMVPIGRGAPVGAIGAYWARCRRATAEELAALEALADAAHAVVVNADLRDRMERAIALRDEFLALAAHELNTPLAVVRLRADALERTRGGAGPPDLRPLHGALDRLTEAVTSLLDFSRASQHGLAIERGPVDLAALAREVTEAARPRAAASGTEVLLDAPAAVTGDWDGPKLARALAHLLDNAVKFGHGRPVEVAAREVAGEARFSVRDRGPGVPCDERERIFGKFERAASPAHVGGLGIGLWLAREIAEAHGGTLTVEAAPGEGALFTLRLPLRLPG
jgi:signal transduction histidine kinase